jgi:hypothetical protein
MGKTLEVRRIYACRNNYRRRGKRKKQSSKEQSDRRTLYRLQQNRRTERSGKQGIFRRWIAFDKKTVWWWWRWNVKYRRGNPSSYTGPSLSDIYSQYLAGIRAQAEEAYNRKMENISRAYDSARGNLDNNLNETRRQLTESRDYSNKNINTDADDSLRQAYINAMLQKKNLRQNMTAQGLSGGANESTLASLSNNYGNARTDVNTQRNRSLADLEQTFNTNISQAIQQYNNALSSLDLQRMQLENAAQDALANYQTAYSDNMAYIAPSNDAYISALNALQNNQASFTFDPTEANNPYALAQIQQAQTGDTSTNYAKLLQQQALNGANSSQLKRMAFAALQRGANAQSLAQTLNMLGVA